MFQLLGLCTRSDHCKQTKSLNITILASTCSHLAPMDVLPSYLHEDTNILVIFPLMYTRIDVLCLNILLQTFLTQRRSSTTANWISNLEWSVEVFTFYPAPSSSPRTQVTISIFVPFSPQSPGSDRCVQSAQEQSNLPARVSAEGRFSSLKTTNHQPFNQPSNPTSNH